MATIGTSTGAAIIAACGVGGTAKGSSSMSKRSSAGSAIPSISTSPSPGGGAAGGSARAPLMMALMSAAVISRMRAGSIAEMLSILESIMMLL